MTEPYHKKSSPLENLPNSIRYILESLQLYKESVHKLTYKSQSPQIVNLLKVKLSDVGTEILRVLNNSNTQTVYPELEELLESIRPQIRALSSRDRIILTRWIEQMFFQNPYTVDLKHIQNLADTWYEPTQNSKQKPTQKQNQIQNLADTLYEPTQNSKQKPNQEQNQIQNLADTLYEPTQNSKQKPTQEQNDVPDTEV